MHLRVSRGRGRRGRGSQGLCFGFLFLEGDRCQSFGGHIVGPHTLLDEHQRQALRLQVDLLDQADGLAPSTKNRRVSSTEYSLISRLASAIFSHRAQRLPLGLMAM